MSVKERENIAEWNTTLSQQFVEDLRHILGIEAEYSRVTRSIGVLYGSEVLCVLTKGEDSSGMLCWKANDETINEELIRSLVKSPASEFYKSGVWEDRLTVRASLELIGDPVAGATRFVQDLLIEELLNNYLQQSKEPVHAAG